MKTRICLLLFVFLFSLAVGPSRLRAAYMGEFTLMWGYTPPWDPAVVEYVIYCNGVEVASEAGAHVEGMRFQFDVSPFGRKLTFTLTCRFADGTESGHSAPCVVDSPLKEKAIDPPGFFQEISTWLAYPLGLFKAS
jgi:hypothetical protein